MLTTTHMANWTPLAWLSYAIDYRVWGLNPAGYHLTNVLLHALNALMLFALARRLLRLSLPAADERSLRLGALAAALAFSLHPLRAESVAWAAERRDVLAGAFCLGTLILYVDAARARGRERARLLALSVACYAGAVLSKATAVPLPAALVALDLYPLRRAAWRDKLPYAALAALGGFMAVHAQMVSGNLVAVERLGAGARVAQSLHGLGFYLWKTVLPAGLSALYPLIEDPRARLAAAAAGALQAAAVVAACLLAGVPRRAQVALWLFYVAMLSPVLGLIQNGPQAVAARYSYLSCLGWAVLFGAAAARWGRRRPVAAALAAWLVLCAAAAQAQIARWRDDGTLWSDVIARFPLSADANINMADALLRSGDAAAAEPYARVAARLAPGNRYAVAALAESLMSQRRDDEAQAALEEGLKAEPNAPEEHALLGVILAHLGRPSEALPHLEAAARLKPGSAEAHANAAALLGQLGRFSEALPYARRAAALEPANPQYAGLVEHLRRDLDEGSGLKFIK